MLEKTLESPLDSKEIKPVYSKGNQSWIFIGRTAAEAEAPITWLPNAKWLIGKDLDAGERVKAGGEGDDRGQDGWVASVTRWTRAWASSRSWWWTGKPGMRQSWGCKESNRLSYWTEPNWIEGENQKCSNNNKVNMMFFWKYYVSRLIREVSI